MSTFARISVFLLGLGVLAFVVNLVRTRRLQERYALLWLLAGIALTTAPVVINQLDVLALTLGFDYTPAFLLVLAVIGLLMISLQLSLSNSRINENLKVVSQELGMLREQMDGLTQRLEAQHDAGRAPAKTETSAETGVNRSHSAAQVGQSAPDRKTESHDRPVS